VYRKAIPVGRAEAQKGKHDFSEIEEKSVCVCVYGRERK